MSATPPSRHLSAENETLAAEKTGLTRENTATDYENVANTRGKTENTRGNAAINDEKSAPMAEKTESGRGNDAIDDENPALAAEKTSLTHENTATACENAASNRGKTENARGNTAIHAGKSAPTDGKTENVRGKTKSDPGNDALAASAGQNIKPRYELLDGLRGVAALLVILFHFGEGFATTPADQWINHGYLAVDFFFILSGFVIGYAYDDRWTRGMTARRFMWRRVVRLHPLVVLSMLLGAAAFVLQGSVQWDGTPVDAPRLLLCLALSLFLLPAWPGAACEVRGNGEMFPLNGPAWSLFFEYIGSLAYALFLHSVGKRTLRLIVSAGAAALAATALGNASGFYNLGVGWSLADGGFWGGLARLSFSFPAGLLMARSFRPMRVRGAFWLCSAALVAMLSMPYVGDSAGDVRNAVFDLVCTLVVFPAIVWLGACGATTDAFSTRLCATLGQLSYPIYILHYPLMYLFYAWVWQNGVSPREALPVCAAMLVVIPALAWTALHFYDIPLREALGRHLSGRR